MLDAGLSRAELGVFWSVLTVKPRHEFAAQRSLEARGLEAYVPTYPERRRWSDRVRTIRRCLFPGYVFARFGPSEESKVLQARGVLSVVKFGAELAAVSAEDVTSLQTLVASGCDLEPVSEVISGRKVRIEHGPLRGAVGIVTRWKSCWSLAVSLELMGQSVIATGDLAALRQGSQASL